VKRRLAIWTALGGWRAEVAAAELMDEGVRATGTQLGVDPLPYRLDYELDAGEGWVTRRLRLEVTGETWKRALELVRDAEGRWSYDVAEEGQAPLPPAGGDTAPLADALDCDLAYSPLTNVMPVRRTRLHEQPGVEEFAMAWVSVPDLEIHMSEQRYEHVRRDESGSIVRFSSGEGRDRFVSDLELDEDGLVRVYPQLARRVG
jgi:hypothetical protein